MDDGSAPSDISETATDEQAAHAESGHSVPLRHQGDLIDDWALQGCRTIHFAGAERPCMGKIALLAKLGRGATGIVYYGINPRLGSEVAVKVLPRALQEQQGEMLRRKEAVDPAAAAEVQHGVAGTSVRQTDRVAATGGRAGSFGRDRVELFPGVDLRRRAAAVSIATPTCLSAFGDRRVPLLYRPRQ